MFSQGKNDKTLKINMFTDFSEILLKTVYRYIFKVMSYILNISCPLFSGDCFYKWETSNIRDKSESI